MKNLYAEIKDKHSLSDAEIAERIKDIPAFGKRGKLMILKDQLTTSTPSKGYVVGSTRTRGREFFYFLSSESPVESNICRVELRGYRGLLPSFGSEIRVKDYQVRNQSLILNSYSTIEKIGEISESSLNEVANLCNFSSDIDKERGFFALIGDIISLTLVRDLQNDSDEFLPLWDEKNRQLNIRFRAQDEDGDFVFKIKKPDQLAKLLDISPGEMINTIKEFDSDLECLDLIALELENKRILAVGEGGKFVGETELTTPYLTFHRWGGVVLLGESEKEELDLST